MAIDYRELLVKYTSHMNATYSGLRYMTDWPRPPFISEEEWAELVDIAVSVADQR